MLVRRVWPSRPTFDGPFADVDQVRREVLRLLDAARGDTFSEVAAGVFPQINVSQDNDHVYVRAEVPGIKSSELSISGDPGQIGLVIADLANAIGKVLGWIEKHFCSFGTLVHRFIIPE